MESWIRTHGNAEEIIKHEARRRGWRATIQDRDVDPLEPGPFGPRKAPGRATVVMKAGDDTGATWEYELPELEKDLRATVANVVQGDRMERDRLERPESPIDLGRR